MSIRVKPERAKLRLVRDFGSPGWDLTVGIIAHLPVDERY